MAWRSTDRVWNKVKPGSCRLFIHSVIRQLTTQLNHIEFSGQDTLTVCWKYLFLILKSNKCAQVSKHMLFSKVMRDLATWQICVIGASYQQTFNAEEWCVAWPTGRKWNDWLQPRISCCGCYPFISPRCHAQAYTLYSEYNNALSLSMQTCNQTHNPLWSVCAADLNMDRNPPHLRRPAALDLLSKLCASCLSNTHFSLYFFFFHN